jgi:hypothetical protein
MSGLKKVQTPIDDPRCPYCNMTSEALRKAAELRYRVPGTYAYHAACGCCGKRIAVLPVRRVFVMTTRKTDKTKDDFGNLYGDDALTDKAKVARRMLTEDYK